MSSILEKPVYVPPTFKPRESTYTVDVLELPGTLRRIKFNPDGSTAPVPNQMPTPSAPNGERWTYNHTEPHVFQDKIVFLHTWAREKA